MVVEDVESKYTSAREAAMNEARDAEPESDAHAAAPMRRWPLVALGAVLVLGAGLAWWKLPRAYEGLRTEAPVREGAYASGGRPSPGTAEQRAFFEHALPEFLVALDAGNDAGAAAQTLGAEADGAGLPPALLEAAHGFGRACASGTAAADVAQAPLVQAAAAALNRALADAELGYYVDAQVVRMADGRLRVFAQTFVVEHVGLFLLGAHTERALSIRRLDHTNVDSATLGFTRPEANEGLVQVDRIEEHLVAHLLPTLARSASFRYAEPHVQRSDALTRLEALAGLAIREELMTGLERDAGVRLGTTLQERRALFERWQNLASERDAVFFAPTTYEVDMDALEPHRLALDGFAQLRTQHDTLGEAEVVAAYQHAHETLVQSVTRHELQHRFDYREGTFESAPAALTGTLLPLDAGAALDANERVIVAELSAYCAAMADGPLTKTELALLTRHVLGLGGARRQEARAAGFLLSELDTALFPREPILGDRPLHHAARAERLLGQPTARLRSTLRTLWERWFGRALPRMRPAR